MTKYQNTMKFNVTIQKKAIEFLYCDKKYKNGQQKNKKK